MLFFYKDNMRHIISRAAGGSCFIETTQTISRRNLQIRHTKLWRISDWRRLLVHPLRVSRTREILTLVIGGEHFLHCNRLPCTRPKLFYAILRESIRSNTVIGRLHWISGVLVKLLVSACALNASYMEILGALLHCPCHIPTLLVDADNIMWRSLVLGCNTWCRIYFIMKDAHRTEW